MSEYLLLERTTPGSVSMGEDVVFDTSTVISANISYDDETGEITINEAGIYEIKWNLAIQSSLSGNGLNFAIVPSVGATVTNSNPVKTNEVSGLSIVEVIEAPITLTLTNQGPTAYFSPLTESTGTLTLTQIDDFSESTSAAIIPFASGGPITVTSVASGLVGLPAFVGFGSSAQGVDALGTQINLEGTVLGLEIINFAFSLPRDGVVTNITAFFSVVSAIGVGLGDYNIHCALYRSDNPADNTFDAVPGADVTLSPPFPGLGISLGDIARGTLGVNIPVNAGDRLLLVFYVNPPALSLAASIIGYASAGLAIS